MSFSTPIVCPGPGGPSCPGADSPTRTLDIYFIDVMGVRRP